MATSYDGKVVIATELDTKQAQKSAQGLGGKLKSGLATGAKVTGKALGVVTATATATAGAMVKATKSTMEYGVEVNRNSQKLNMSKKGYQEWSYVLKRSGTSIDSLKMGMKKISTQIDEAKNGSASATENFKRLGLSVDDLKGKSQEEIFGLMVQRLQGIKDTTERSAIANKFFGRSAQEMAGLLNKSGKDVEGLKKQAHDLGLVLSDDAIKKSAEFRGKITELQSAFEGLRNKMAVRFLPSLTQVTDGLSLLVQGKEADGLKKIEKGLKGFSDTLLKTVPTILKVGGSLVLSLSKSIINNLPQLVTTGTQIAVSLIQGVVKMLPTAITMIMQSLNTLLGSLSAQLPTLVTNLINGLLDAVILVIQNVPNLVRVAITFISSLVDALLSAIPTFIERLPEIITALITAQIESMPLIISGLIKLVGKIVLKLPEIIMGIIMAIPNMITQFMDEFSKPEKVQQLVDGFVKTASKVAVETPKMVAKLIEKIPEMIRKFCNALMDKERMKIWAERLKALGSKIAEKLPQMVTAIGTWIKDELPKKIEEWTKDLPDKAYSLGKKMCKMLIKGIKAFIIAKVDIAKQIWGWLKDVKIEDLIIMMGDLGWDMMKGLIKGWWKIFSTQMDIFVKFKKGIMDGFKDAFEIKSPSKVFEKDIGYWLGAGLSKGIVKGYEANDPMKQLNAEIQASAGVLQSQINASLDLNNNIKGLAGAVVEGIENSNLTVKIGERDMGRVVRSY